MYELRVDQLVVQAVARVGQGAKSDDVIVEGGRGGSKVLSSNYYP